MLESERVVLFKDVIRVLALTMDGYSLQVAASDVIIAAATVS
jgi:hypothetical protein